MEQQEKEFTPNRDYVIAIACPGKGTRVFRIKKPIAIFVCVAMICGIGSLVKGAYAVNRANQEQQELSLPYITFQMVRYGQEKK